MEKPKLKNTVEAPKSLRLLVLGRRLDQDMNCSGVASITWQDFLAVFSKDKKNKLLKVPTLMKTT